MLTLLAKDFKLLFANGKMGKWSWVSYLINFLLVAIFVAVETFLFSAILSKIEMFKGSGGAKASDAFLTIFLAVISVLSIFMCVGRAKKLFFEKKDVELLTTLPVDNSQIIFSKIIFLFLFQVVIGLVLIYPVIVAYGLLTAKLPFFYFTAIFYPVLAFPFECGVALILVYPIKLIGDYLQKHTILQLILSVVGLFALCYLYSVILNAFVSIIASGNFDSLLTTSNINAMTALCDFLVPINVLVEIFVLRNTRGLMLYIGVAFGVFIIGLVISIAAFNYFRRIRFNPTRPEKADKTAKIYSVKMALIKKECDLLFKDSGNIFSFTGLLVVQPFLVYLIVSSLNTIFSTGVLAYYISLFPRFLPLLDILLVSLISLSVSNGANGYITAEGKNIRLMKSIPVGIFTQIFIKVAIPFVFSAISFIISYIVLGATAVVEWDVMLFGILITLVTHAVFALASLFEELKIRHGKPKNSFVSSTISYLLPLIYTVAMVVVSYLGVNIYAVYALGIGITLLCGLPYVINFKKRVIRNFEELEVVN
ncbi:MAG: hypothetical protein E7370_00180 [Clostridiales bacterium]|nr:hypothetical protein [Clostridiales bacterium]